MQESNPTQTQDNIPASLRRRVVRYNRFPVQFALAVCTMMLGIWLSSGSMAPIAGTAVASLPTTPCHYLVSVDHHHYLDAFLMLQGADRRIWEGSFFLRRILYPLLSYPLMKWLGFEIGGFVSNVIFHVAAFAAFILYLRKKFGTSASIFAMWLLAFYPGIYYWAGLPYANATIVPCSLLGFIILCEIVEQNRLSKICLLAFLQGMLFLAYDLFPYLGVATIFTLLYLRKYRALLLATVLLLIPSLISNVILTKIVHIPLINSNSGVYLVVFESYFKKPDLAQWYKLLKDFPEIAFQAYLFSNFFFIPCLFGVLCLGGIFLNKWKFLLPEKCLLISGLLLFLFLNLAPPYPGWQMRGVWILRLYQPVFVVLMSYASRALAVLWQQSQIKLKVPALALCGSVCFGNFLISFGPVLHNHFSSHMYYRFYRHSPPDTLYDSITRYGRRPLGFCNANLPPAESPYHL